MSSRAKLRSQSAPRFTEDKVPQFLKSLGLSLLAAVTLTVMFSVTQDACGQGITTGTISGTVVDPSGAAIPDAQITATSSSQGLTRQAKCNASGLFSLRSSDRPIYDHHRSSRVLKRDSQQCAVVNAGAASNLNEVNWLWARRPRRSRSAEKPLRSCKRRIPRSRQRSVRSDPVHSVEQRLRYGC